MSVRFPAVYQVNTRVLLTERGAALGRRASLDDVPDALLEELARRGFSWLWPLGVWQTGEAGQQCTREEPTLRAALAQDLPDCRPEDLVGSPFAVQAYDAHRDFGGDGALERLRRRLEGHGLRLMLDFVPNHLAVDHAWVFEHPERLIHGSEEDLAAAPGNYFRAQTRLGPAILAHGRDPYFPAWTDTVQVNYRHPGARAAELAILARIAERCDGVRCDMAMLLEPEVIARTWGDRARPFDGAPADDTRFWPSAIGETRRRWPAFVFVAEVYWGLEWTLQEQGFDFTYDKRLYDRLRAGVAGPVRDHLQAAPAFRDRCLRFLENHDEPRAAATFELAQHRAAAVLALLAPGMRLVHDGQLEGRRARVAMGVARRLVEPVDERVRAFYEGLLAALARPEAHDGAWRLWPCGPLRQGDASFESLIVSTWEQGERRLLSAVNYGASAAAGTLAVGLEGLAGRRWRLVELLTDDAGAHEAREETGDALAGGLPLELAPWEAHVWELAPA